MSISKQRPVSRAIEHLQSVLDVSFEPTSPEVKDSIRLVLAWLEEVTDHRDEMRDARNLLADLTNVVRSVEKDTIGVFDLFAVHGFEYKGATWEKELKSAVEFLERTR